MHVQSSTTFRLCAVALVTVALAAVGWYAGRAGTAQGATPADVLYISDQSSSPSVGGEELVKMNGAAVDSLDEARARFAEGVTYAVIVDRAGVTPEIETALRAWYSQGVVIVAMGMTAGDLSVSLGIDPNGGDATDSQLAGEAARAPTTLDGLRGAFMYRQSHAAAQRTGCSLAGFGHIADWSTVAARLDTLRGVSQGLVVSGPDGRLVPACK